jgi:hypothetical protein
LKDKLSWHFGTQIQFWQPNFRSESVISEHIIKIAKTVEGHLNWKLHKKNKGKI